MVEAINFFLGMRFVTILFLFVSFASSQFTWLNEQFISNFLEKDYGKVHIDSWNVTNSGQTINKLRIQFKDDNKSPHNLELIQKTRPVNEDKALEDYYYGNEVRMGVKINPEVDRISKIIESKDASTCAAK